MPESSVRFNHDHDPAEARFCPDERMSSATHIHTSWAHACMYPQTFKQMKLRRKHRYIIYKIDVDTVVVEKTGER